MSYSDEGAFTRPYPFQIDNRKHPLDEHLCSKCAKGALIYMIATDTWHCRECKAAFGTGLGGLPSDEIIERNAK